QALGCECDARLLRWALLALARQRSARRDADLETRTAGARQKSGGAGTLVGSAAARALQAAGGICTHAAPRPKAAHHAAAAADPAHRCQRRHRLALKASAKADPDSTTALWQRLRADQLLTQRDSDSVRRAIGRQLIIAGDFGVLPWLLEHDPNGEDSYLLEWRLRLALRDRNWTLVARSIPQLPVEMAQSSRWSYWLARALAEQRDDPAKQQSAAELFTLVAKERGFYGFLAADT